MPDAAAVDESEETLLGVRAHRVRERGKDLLLGGFQGKGEQEEGIEQRRVDLGKKQLVIPLPKQGAHGHAVSDVSADSCALIRSASTNSSISPFITASSLYRVRLMRWSVARFWGKL